MFELRGETLGEDGLLEQRLVAGVRLLAPLAPGLGAEPVDGGGVCDPAKPGTRRASTRIEAAPALESPLERLGREILRRSAVTREVDEVAVDGVEMLRDDVRERRSADHTGRADGCRQGVHAPHTAPTLRIVTPERYGVRTLNGMRRLLILVSALVWVDTMLFAALTPLLPHFTRDLHLSKAGAGVLVGAYAGGALIGGLPGGVATARLGARRAVLVGLTLMGLASLGFAFAHGFWPLIGARLLQGMASGFTWAGSFAWLLAAAPRDRRGQLIGTALGAAVFGALFGPVVGAVAALIGRAAVFTALAGLSVVLGVWTLRIESIPPEPPSLSAVARALRDGRFRAGLGLMLLPALLWGVLSVLAPLRLADAGWGAAAIGAVWLVGAGLETAVSPLAGRMLDRRGAGPPIQISLATAAVFSVGLAFSPRPLAYVPLLIAASGAYGALFTPAFALIADGAERSGLPQGMAFGLMNAAWASGALVGPAAGGAVAAATGDVVPFTVAAVLCGAAFAAVQRTRHRTTANLAKSDLAG